MWGDAAPSPFCVRPLRREIADDEDEEVEDGPEQRSSPRGRLQKRNLFRRVVQRDSMSLTRERLPDLVHVFPDDFLGTKKTESVEDDTSDMSESSGVDSLVLARARHVPPLNNAHVPTTATIPSSSSSVAANVVDVPYRIQKFRTGEDGKIVWDLPEDISKSEHHRLEEGMLKDGPRGGVNCAA